MDLHLTNKIVVVTGGSAGIGKAIIEEFLKEGATVATVGRREQPLADLAAELKASGYDLYYEAHDVSDRAGMSAFAENVFNKFGRIDVWVNNAGVNRLGKFMDYTDDDYDYVMNINLKAVFQCTQIAASYMKKQKSGVIINAESFAQRLAQANSTIYAASKAGVSSFTKSTAAALAPYGIRVIGYMPGVIATPLAFDMIKKNPEKYTKDIAMHRVGEPAEAAKPIVFLASDCASFVNAVNLEISGGKFAVQDCNMAYELEAE